MLKVLFLVSALLGSLYFRYIHIIKHLLVELIQPRCDLNSIIHRLLDKIHMQTPYYVLIVFIITG